MRDRVVPRNPRTADQTRQRNRLARAVATWSGLDPGVRAAWEAYARSLAVTDPESGLPRTPRAMNLFTAQFTKLMQLDPAAAPPLSPPGNPFFGDAVSVTVAPMWLGRPAPGPQGGPPSPGGVGEGLDSPFRDPFVPDAPEGTGATFTADRANSAGVVTELLLQPLATGARRAYRDKYRAQGFVAFAPGSLSATVPALPGWHACGVRFVNAATGQATPVVELGTVLVGAGG